MDGLGGAASVIAVLQITAEIGKLCGGYIRGVKHAREDIERLQSKVSALHEVLKRLNNVTHPNIEAAEVRRCCDDLCSLKERLEPKKTQATMKPLGVRALKWPFTSKEVGKQLQALEQYLSCFKTTLQLNVHEKIYDAEQERLLEKLAFAGDALFNSYENDQRHRPCLENTRVDVLQQVTKWTTDISPKCIFWLKGLAGMGKSTIATTVASHLATTSSPIASYFFKRGHSDLAHARKLIPTIVRQLSQHHSSYCGHVLEALEKEPGLGQSANLREQYEKLLVEPLRKIRPAQHLFFIIMDALDECEEQRDLRMLLKLLARTEDIPELGLKIFVTSRPELPIRHGFEEIPSIFHRNLALQNVPRSVVDGDIKTFLSYELKEIQYEFRLPADWPAEEDLETLARKAGGLFIFAATACRYVGGSSQAEPPERLKQICSSVATNKLMTEELDEMYAMVLQNAISGKHTAEERRRARVRFHYIVGCIVLLLDPLPISHLFDLVHGSHVESQQELEGVLQTLHAVIDVPDDATSAVQPLHLSFRDFLLDPGRCLDHHFWVDEKQAHRDLALGCMHLLSSSLSRNMCGLPSLGTLRSEIDLTIVEDTLSRAVQYACRHWVDHAQRGSMVVDDHGCIHSFLQQHFLHWVECMSLMGRISEAITSMTNLTAITDFQTAPLAHEFINDCWRFVMAFRPAIEQTPGQVYASALLFSPSQSNLREKFKDIVPQWIRVKPQLHERWSPCLQTLACGRWIGKVAFSRDGKLLASSSNGLTSSRYEHLDIWDPQTGECQSHLKASTEGSALEKLAPDGQIVVSVSRDGIISLWDMAKCENRFILENHPRPITAAEFSFDSKSLALGSQDGIIRLLDTQRGEHRCTLEGHSEEIVSLVFSPDCTMIATGAKDRTAQIWNLQTGSRRFTIERPASPSLRGFPLVEMMVFSPQSRFLASTSGENAIRLWDAVNGECRFDLEGCSGTVLELKFSPDGGLLASASQDNTVRLWDMQTGGCRATTTGCGMAFSPDGQFLALRSRDNLVRLWSVQREEYRSILDGHTQVVSTLCFSPDGRFLVSGSGDCTVRLWDMHMGDYFPIDESESASAKVSEVVFLPNGKLVASVSSNRRIRLWNSETGDCCLDYEGHSVSFSSDGQLVISASEDGVRLVDVRTGHHRFLVEGYIYVAVLSPDGQLAAATSHDQSIQLWNTHNGDSSFTFEGHHSTSVSSLIFSPNGDLIASRLEVDGAEIWNTRTGECVATFTDRSDIPGTMAFAPNGELLASGGYGPPHCLRLWDVLAGCLRFNLKGHSDHIETVVFSPNSRLVAGGSWDPTVLLWDTETGECILTIPCLSLKPRIEFLTGIDAVFVDGIAHETGSTKMTQAEIASQGRLLSDLQVDSSREWVTKSSERLLWLPPERRGYRYAVWRNKIAIGAGNGRMTFLTIEDEPGRQSGDDQRREEAMALRPTQLLPPPS